MPLPATTLADLVEDARSATDVEERWSLIVAIAGEHGADVVAAGERLFASGAAADRELAADLLGQVGGAGAAMAAGPCDALLAQLAVERDADVLHALAVALGHRRDGRAVAPLVELAAHDAAQVRCGAAFGLVRHREVGAVAALVALSADVDVTVRDWATFGLRLAEDDSENVRAALVDRLADPDGETRHEAMAALAARGDERAVEPIAEELEHGRDVAAVRTIALAMERTTHHPRLVAALGAAAG